MARKKKVEIPSTVEEVLTDNEPIEHKDEDILECEITKAFMDKYNENLYEVGKKYKFSYKRIKEILAKNKKYLKILDK